MLKGRGKGAGRGGKKKAKSPSFPRRCILTNSKWYWGRLGERGRGLRWRSKSKKEVMTKKGGEGGERSEDTSILSSPALLLKKASCEAARAVRTYEDVPLKEKKEKNLLGERKVEKEGERVTQPKSARRFRGGKGGDRNALG